jgi:hypothetical protein
MRLTSGTFARSAGAARDFEFAGIVVAHYDERRCARDVAQFEYLSALVAHEVVAVPLMPE